MILSILTFMMLMSSMFIVIVPALAVLSVLAAVLFSRSTAGAADEIFAATASWSGYGKF